MLVRIREVISGFLSDLKLVSGVLFQFMVALINFSLRDWKIFARATGKNCSFQITAYAFFFGKVGVDFICCNSPSYQVEETMPFHSQLKHSFISDRFECIYRVCPNAWIWSYEIMSGEYIGKPK